MRELLPTGLICPLFIPSGGAAESLVTKLAQRVLPHVDGLALDPGVFHDGPPVPGGEMAGMLAAVLKLSPQKPVFVKLSGESEGEVAGSLEALKGALGKSDRAGPVFLLDMPLGYRGNRGLPGYYQTLLKATEMSLVLVNDAGRLKAKKGVARRKNIRTAILKRLAENDAIAGLIHRGTVARGLNYARATSKRPSFCLYEGDEGQYIQSPSRAGVFAPSANLLPGQWAALVKGIFAPRAAARVDAARLFGLGERLTDLARAVKAAPHHAVAAGLAMLGLMPEPPSRLRAPLQRDLARLLDAGAAGDG